MEKMKVRCIGGPVAGDVMWIRAPYFNVPDHPSFPSCRVCEPEDFPNEPVPMHIVRYIVHKFHFGTGHEHLYAAPEGMPAVGVFNELWHTYREVQNGN
jgi:hypothetical protein